MLSVVVLTLNEAHNIGECLDSVKAFADELLVLDSGSKDGTRELARRAGALVHERTFDNYPAQRNAALDAARGGWVFFIDADERAHPALGEEIHSATARADAQSDGAVLFWVPRRNYIFGKWIRHTGWSPDYQPRVLKKGRVRFDPRRPVHELVVASGAEGFLKNALVHFNYSKLSQFHAKQKVYTRFEAQDLFARNIRPSARAWIGQPAREFVRRFITLRGYKDGGHGLVLSALMAYYAFERQRLLLQLWKGEQEEAQDF